MKLKLFSDANVVMDAPLDRNAFHEDARLLLTLGKVGEPEIDSAMALGWPDVEDAVLHEAARVTNPVALITHNKANHPQSTLPTYTCGEFFAWLKEERGLSYAEIALP